MARISIVVFTFCLINTSLINRVASQIILPLPSITTIVTVNTSDCFNGITAFVACSSMLSTLMVCATPTETTAQLDCYCQQALFNLIGDCQNEGRLCDASPAVDYPFELQEDHWHSVCDSFVSFSVTTPPISSLSQKIDYQACNELYPLCISAGSGRAACTSSATATPDLLNCLCQPVLTSLYSRCQFDGNISCYGQPASTDAIIGHKFCARWLVDTSLAANDTLAVLSSYGLPTWVPSSATTTISDGSLGAGRNTITAKHSVPKLTTGLIRITSTTSRSGRVPIVGLGRLIATFLLALCLNS